MNRITDGLFIVNGIFFFLECVLILPLITTLDSVTLHTINPEKRCIHPPFSFLNSWYKYDFPHALFTL